MVDSYSFARSVVGSHAPTRVRALTRLTVGCATLATIVAAVAYALGVPTTAQARSAPPQRLLLGESRIEAGPDSDAAGLAEAFPLFAGRSGTALSIHIYIDRHNRARRLILGLYSNSHGTPALLLRKTRWWHPRAGGWRTATVHGLRLIRGHHYWLALLSQRGAVSFRDRAGGRCSSENSRQHHLRGLARRWTRGPKSQTCPVSAYVSGTARGNAPQAPGPPPVTGGPPPSPKPPAPPAPPTPQVCNQTFTPSTVGSSPYPGSAVNRALQGASGGQTFCFAAGSYGEIDLYAAHPGARVALEPVTGAAATGISFDLNGVSNVTMTGFSGASSSGGLTLQAGTQGNNSNITFSYNAMSSSGVSVSGNSNANANIDIAHNSFIGFGSSSETSRMEVINDNACPNGVTVEYNRMSGGRADGIDISGSSCQTQIVHNVIDNILEQNCGGIHCDGFQDNGGGNGTVLAYNYFFNDTDCFLLDDGSSNYNIHDNVCQTNTGDSSFWMQFGGAAGITLSHNTVLSTNGAQYGNDHNSNPSSNVVFSNNIFYSDPQQTSGPASGAASESYNLCPSGCGGSHETKATPKFAGGGSPSSWAGFALAAGSPGLGAGSDGANQGVSSLASAPGP